MLSTAIRDGICMPADTQVLIRNVLLTAQLLHSLQNGDSAESRVGKLRV